MKSGFHRQSTDNHITMPTCPRHNRELTEGQTPIGPVLYCPEATCDYGERAGKGRTSLRQGKLPGLDPGRQAVALSCPSEAAEQKLLFDLIHRWQRRYWPLSLVFAVPNGAWVANHAQAVKLLETGLLPGVADVCCPVPSGGYAGLWVELKRLRGEGPSREQAEWLEMMRWLGYRAEWRRGGWEAWRLVCDYLGIALDAEGAPVE